MADKHYDRSTQDLGNIVNLGHVNVCISDQHLATRHLHLQRGVIFHWLPFSWRKNPQRDAEGA